MDLAKLGSKIKRARIEAGLTQMEAAQRVGLCRATIIAVEKGKTVPRYDKMIKLAQVLKLEKLKRKTDGQTRGSAPSLGSTAS
jgi:DNA-binding XRE family transcriptional regulator